MLFAELHVGQAVERSRQITAELIDQYAALTGDFSPSHVSEEAAAKTRFGTRIAHGMLSAGILSALIGMDLPGPGTIWVEQNFKFKLPVKVGDTITWRGEITELVPERKRVKIKVVCRNQRGEVAIEGEGKLLMLE